MKWYALRFDDAGLVLPGAITATGKGADGPFTLVMGPYTGSVVFVVRRKDGVFRSVSERKSDSPEHPSTPIRDVDGVVSRALASAKPKELTSLNRRWYGQWTGRLLCGARPVVELDRQISGARLQVRSMQQFGWKWSVTLGGSTKDGTATQLRDAVSYARAATRELIAAREATRATGERKDTPRDRLDRSAARAWTRERVRPTLTKAQRVAEKASALRTFTTRIHHDRGSWDVRFEAPDARAAARHADALAEDWSSQHGRSAYADAPKAGRPTGRRA